MLSLLKIENIKIYLIIAGIIAGIWFYKDWQFKSLEYERLKENTSQQRKADSLGYSKQILTRKEFEEYLEYSNKELKQYFLDHSIKPKQIERIIDSRFEYLNRDTAKINLQPIVDAIKENKSIKVPIAVSDSCMYIGGYVLFDNDTLSLDITNRKFTNKSEVIAYWERTKKFLFIKYGKKKTTFIVKDNCGRTETFEIEIYKKK